MHSKISLDLFLKPKSIAIIGLSRKAVNSPVSILTTIKRFGYEGEIFVVNPKLKTLEDLKVFPDLGAIKRPVDLAIISLSRSYVLDVLKDCVNNKIRAAVVITQGFADADEEGRRLQRDMVALTKEHGIRILGPNTMGVMNAFSDFTSSFFEVANEKIPIGLIAQSGLFMMGYQAINNVKAGFGMAMDLGNACDVNASDVLEYYENEDNIKVIHSHM
jgi:acetyltransferase